jgi:membrane associated rhomboid family serine protease
MRLPPVTQALLIALGLAFLLQKSTDSLGLLQLMLWPLGDRVLGIDAAGQAVQVGFRPWQLLTYALLHGDFMHLFLNALALLQFGPAIEQVWGGRRYLIFVLACVAGAGVLQLVVAAMGLAGSEPNGVIGASGGVYAVLLAYGMLFPKHRLMMMFPPIEMSARTLVIVYGAAALLLGFTGMQPGIAHFVHLGGMLFGWLFVRHWRTGRPPPPSRLV